MDPYAPCPCGSGKKVKFCCQAILPEMAKIERLQENNQPRMALKAIEKLMKDHKDNGWLVCQKAMALLNEENLEEARDCLLSYLRKEQEHPLANGLLAICVSQLEPIEKSKKVIHRAFIKSMASEPQLVSLLASRLVAYYLDEGLDMAARQHMAIMMRLGSDESRQGALMAMLELDSDTSVPYPLRGPHPLPLYAPSDELLPQFKKSQRLFVAGCFSEAADILDKLTESDESSPELWHTIGLMRAWDGDEAAAAIALHRASGLYSDFETAVDLETLAQLLDRRQPENTRLSLLRTFNVEKLSQLLTRLDNDDHLCRVQTKPEMTQNGIAATYEILDRELPTEDGWDDVNLDSAPQSIGHLVLVDQSEANGTPRALLTAFVGEFFDKASEIFEHAAGEMASRIPEGEIGHEDNEIMTPHSKEDLPISMNAYFAPTMPPEVRQRLRLEYVESSLKENWLITPQAALNDKAPQEAAGDDTLKVKLAAAIRVFDAFVDRLDLMLDHDELCEQLSVQKPESLPVSERMDLNSLTVAQLRHLNFNEMPDELFNRVMQRALLLKHCGHSYQVLNELLKNRSELVEANQDDSQQAIATIADICSRSLKVEETLEWIERGFQFVKEHGAKFESLLMWRMRELSFRARDPKDPRIKELLLELWNQYGGKLPVVRQRLQEFVNAMEIEAPWESAILTPSGAGWGEASGAGQQEPKKLWLGD